MHRTQFTIHFRRLFPVIAATVALAACSSAPPRNENLGVQQMYQRALHQEQQDNYQKALDDYNALEARYPFGPYATRAQLEQVYLTSRPVTTSRRFPPRTGISRSTRGAGTWTTFII